MWLLIAIVVLIVLLGLVYIFSKHKRPVDYYNLFIMGIIWTGSGIAIGVFALWVMGLIFMGIGGFNQDKWKKNRKKWSKLSKSDRKITILVMIILGLLVLAGLVLLLVR